MNQTDFMAQCAKAFDEHPMLPAPTEEQLYKLFLLTERMLDVNQHMNLTAIKDPIDVIYKHYVDCASLLPLLPQNAKVIDVGCGAGFPSLPTAIFRPDLSITAIDSTGKRIQYVSDTARLLSLDRLTAITARAEEAGRSAEHREQYDVATARAVASLPVLCELCMPFVRLDGLFLAMKGPLALQELSSAASAIETCGGCETSDIPFSLYMPSSALADVRHIISVKKTAHTPRNLPRNFSQLSKKPL
ncbi:MAG: 16S rRNA (guanine(527)-N(7))-methyltransferase RsmG [Ruminococcaceae bacterium]|nr:16S rRNA (guanine(527)-N(7))-methyltransferase RsmG [Oscillospiraceae bacterium]